ncbi:MAG TPA: hypothetical protein VLD65_00750 [Anaerolineales bacterium]|nr:hypothetical protein [Anaerolineales bacterium]
MNLEKLWESDYNKELERAEQARLERNEGMARVCARRAAGILIGEYLRRRGVSGLTNSAYDRLTFFNSLQDVDEDCKQVCRHFLLKVNQEHNLPMNADLIHDVIWLKNQLLNKG